MVEIIQKSRIKRVILKILWTFDISKVRIRKTV